MAIKGLDRLNKKLVKLPKVAEQAIKAAMEQGADEMVALAKSLVPVDSGDLRDSVGWTWGTAPRGSITFGNIKSADGSLTLTIYAGDERAFYARWVEFGTKTHNVAKGGGTKLGKLKHKLGGGITHPGSNAKPFFYVSWRPLKRRIKSRITRATNKAAKQVAAGGG